MRFIEVPSLVRFIFPIDGVEVSRLIPSDTFRDLMIWEEPSRREECPVCQAESRARLEFSNTQGQKDMPELRWTVALRCMAEGKPPPEKEVGHSPPSSTKCSLFSFPSHFALHVGTSPTANEKAVAWLSDIISRWSSQSILIKMLRSHRISSMFSRNTLENAVLVVSFFKGLKTQLHTPSF